MFFEAVGVWFWYCHLRSFFLLVYFSVPTPCLSSHRWHVSCNIFTTFYITWCTTFMFKGQGWKIWVTCYSPRYVLILEQNNILHPILSSLDCCGFSMVLCKWSGNRSNIFIIHFLCTLNVCVCVCVTYRSSTVCSWFVAPFIFLHSFIDVKNDSYSLWCFDEWLSAYLFWKCYVAFRSWSPFYPRQQNIVCLALLTMTPPRICMKFSPELTWWMVVVISSSVHTRHLSLYFPWLCLSIAWADIWSALYPVLSSDWWFSPLLRASITP